MCAKMGVLEGRIRDNIINEKRIFPVLISDRLSFLPNGTQPLD